MNKCWRRTCHTAQSWIHDMRFGSTSKALISYFRRNSCNIFGTFLLGPSLLTITTIIAGDLNSPPAIPGLWLPAAMSSYNHHLDWTRNKQFKKKITKGNLKEKEKRERVGGRRGAEKETQRKREARPTSMTLTPLISQDPKLWTKFLRGIISVSLW